MKRKILFIGCIIIFVFSAYKVFSIIKDYERANNEYEKLSAVYTNEESVKAINTDKEKTDYSFKNINFESLEAINPDIAGWITIPETNIDYPIVYSYDNKEYLEWTFQKEYNPSGSIFIDMRNSKDFSDFNTVIYGHNMKDGSMFGQLKKYQDETFHLNHENIEIYTPRTAHLYHIISAYATTSEDECYNTDIKNKEDYSAWLEKIVNKSTLEGEKASVDKKTITLSTCNGLPGTDKRWIVHIQEADFD